MQNHEKISFILNELITNYNTSSIQEVFSNEYIVHTSKKDYQGHKIIIKWTKDLHNFLADLKIVKIQFLVNRRIHRMEKNLTWKNKTFKEQKLKTRQIHSMG